MVDCSSHAPDTDRGSVTDCNCKKAQTAGDTYAKTATLTIQWCFPWAATAQMALQKTSISSIMTSHPELRSRRTELREPTTGVMDLISWSFPMENSTSTFFRLTKNTANWLSPNLIIVEFFGIKYQCTVR